MRIIEIIEGKESNLVDEFLKSTTQKYNKRDMCGPACLDFIDWARREKGIDLKRVRGEFIADEVVSAKADFTPEMKKEFFRSGLDWNSAEDRKAWIEQSKYAEEWKGVPHYWTVDDKGNIHDPSGYQQLIKTGLAKDLDPSRYIPEGIKENFADGKEKGLDGKACWKGYKIGSPKTKMKGGKRVDNCVKENVGDTWNVGDKFLVNTDDPKNKKLTVDKIKGNKLLGSDTKWYSKYGVTKEGLNAIPEDIYLEEDWKKTLAVAAVAVGTSTAPMPAHADADILSAITKLTRAFGSIQRITPNSVKGDIKGEIGNQARRGDASSQNLTIQNRGKTQVSKFNKWDGKLGNQESIETEAVFTPDDTIVTDIMTKLASLVKRPAGQSMIGRMFSKKPEQPTEVEIKFPTGRMSVDKFTAKAVLDAYAKINPKNQGNMDQLLGTKQGFSQIVDKLTKDGKIREGVDINVVLGQIILESKINEYGVGIITKQNSTPDVKPGETQRQAAKFGNKLNKKGLPPMVNEQIKTINKIGEELYQIDRDDPMLKSQVLVPGVGRMNIDSLHKNLAEKFLDLADKMKAMSPEQAEQANYLLQKSPLRVMLNALSDAYAELENVRRKGGRNSRGIGA